VRLSKLLLRAIVIELWDIWSWSHDTKSKAKKI